MLTLSQVMLLQRVFLFLSPQEMATFHSLVLLRLHAIVKGASSCCKGCTLTTRVVSSCFPSLYMGFFLSLMCPISIFSLWLSQSMSLRHLCILIGLVFLPMRWTYLKVCLCALVHLLLSTITMSCPLHARLFCSFLSKKIILRRPRLPMQPLPG